MATLRIHDSTFGYTNRHFSPKKKRSATIIGLTVFFALCGALVAFLYAFNVNYKKEYGIDGHVVAVAPQQRNIANDKLVEVKPLAHKGKVLAATIVEEKPETVKVVVIDNSSILQQLEERKAEREAKERQNEREAKERQAEIRAQQEGARLKAEFHTNALRRYNNSEEDKARLPLLITKAQQVFDGVKKKRDLGLRQDVSSRAKSRNQSEVDRAERELLSLKSALAEAVKTAELMKVELEKIDAQNRLPEFEVKTD